MLVMINLLSLNQILMINLVLVILMVLFLLIVQKLKEKRVLEKLRYLEACIGQFMHSILRMNAFLIVQYYISRLHIDKIDTLCGFHLFIFSLIIMCLCLSKYTESECI